MTQQEETRKPCTVWRGTVRTGKSIRIITQENYGFRKQLDDATQKSRIEIQNIMKAYREENASTKKKSSR